MVPAEIAGQVRVPPPPLRHETPSTSMELATLTVFFIAALGLGAMMAWIYNRFWGGWL